MGDTTGKVWLVGAGSSAAGLLTLRGEEVLRAAETVVYDHLLGCGILSRIPERAEKIYVGKTPGQHMALQEEINEILIGKALEGRRVVRLKGGDPFLFGRGGEELAALRARGIPCEVVPGVSSAFAVPEYAGIPVTHRGIGSSLHIFTGHPSSAGKRLPDFSILAGLKGTLVFLMGVAAAESICSGLQNAGMPGDTPAAAVENGTSARQRVVSATLGTLAAEMGKRGICPPAVLVIGQTAAFAGKLDWASDLPLAGRRVVVTRPRAACAEFCRKIEALGGEAVAFPCLEAVPGDEDLLREAVGRLASFTWAAFSSTACAEAFLRALFRAGKDMRALAGLRIAAVGPATGAWLKAHGIVPDRIPAVFDGRHLGRELAAQAGPGDAVLVLRARKGSRGLEEELRRAGIPTEAVPACETRPAARTEAPELQRIVARGEFDFLTFASASAVRGFAEAVPDLELSGRTAVCIGPETAGEARRYGMKAIAARAASVESMLETLMKLSGASGSVRGCRRQDGQREES